MYRGKHAGLLISIVLLVVSLSACFGREGGEEKAQQKEELQSVPSAQQAATEPEAEEKERELKIGFLGPLTGEGALYGQSVLAGMVLAAKEINKLGGGGSKALGILQYDTKGNPGLTNEYVEKFIQEGVIAIMAAPTGWSTFAPTRMVNDYHTIFISIGTKRRIGRSGPFVFRMTLPDEIAAKKLLDYSKNQGHTKYALITSSLIDHSLGMSFLFKDGIVKNGGSIVVEADTYDTYSGQRSVKKVIVAITKAPKPDAVIYTGDAKEGALLAKAVSAAGLDIPMIGGEELFTETYLKEGGSAVRGTLLYATYSPHNEAREAKRFTREYKNQKGKEPNRFAALAYDAFLIITEAVKRAGSTRPTVVRKALLEIDDFSGVTGPTGFAPSGEPVKTPFLYTIIKDGAGEKLVLLKE